MVLDIGPPILAESWAPIVGGVLGGVVVFSLSMYALKNFWLEPATRDADVITAALRYLYNNMFGQNSGHCITFLAQRHPRSRYIRPRYRFAYGPGTRLRSRTRFQYGSALAGTAWERPGGAKIFVKTMPDFGSDEGTRLDFWQREFGLTRREIARLSPRSLQSRWILTYGIVHPPSGNFIGVISIDSQDEKALEEVDTDEIIMVATIIASIIQVPSSWFRVA